MCVSMYNKEKNIHVFVIADVVMLSLLLPTIAVVVTVLIVVVLHL